MKKEIKEKWVAALRSGDYEQGSLRLRTAEDKYCCLGVLTDLYLKETGGEWERDVTTSGWVGAKSSAALAGPVMEWAGLEGDSFVEVEEEYGFSKINRLSVLNDSKSYDFNKIADIIETNL